MTLIARRRGIEGLLVASVMLLAGLILLLLWPLKQLTLVPVVALVALAPSVHALVLRDGAQRWTLFAGGLVAGIAAIVPWLESSIWYSNSGCTVSTQPTAIVVVLAGMVAFGAAYVLAVAVTLRLAIGAVRASRLALPIIAGVTIMGLGIAAWGPLFNLMLRQVMEICR